MNETTENTTETPVPFEERLDRLKAEAAAESPLPRKCVIEQMLPASVIELVKAAPTNDTVRSVLLAHLKQPIPDGARDYDAIKAWIETNLEPPAKPAMPPRPQPRAVINIPINGSETEIGTCRYTVQLSGSGDFPIREDELLEMAEESEDFGDLVDRVMDHIQDEGVMEYLTMEPDDNSYEYENHEIADSRDFDWEYGAPLESIIRRAMERLNPDRLADLG